MKLANYLWMFANKMIFSYLCQSLYCNKWPIGFSCIVYIFIKCLRQQANWALHANINHATQAFIVQGCNKGTMFNCNFIIAITEINCNN